MTILPPEPSEPRRPLGPRDPGDAWVVAPDGTKYWGRFGAAGLLAVDDARGVLLQERVHWSHFGGTWGIPGGAKHEGESAIAGALRESHEEAGVPLDAIRPLMTSVLDLEYWTYTTLVGVVERPFEPEITDPESVSLHWVPVDQVDDRPLHPGFAAAWPSLREWLRVRPSVVVDAANVMGSTPDGWWKDRAGAAARVVTDLAELATRGVSADALELGGTQWFPRFTAVVEGAARSVDDVTGVDVVRASGSGDDAIVDAVADLATARGAAVTVVTSDRELRSRVEALGARAVSVSWLWQLLGAE